MDRTVKPKPKPKWRDMSTGEKLLCVEEKIETVHEWLARYKQVDQYDMSSDERLEVAKTLTERITTISSGYNEMVKMQKYINNFDSDGRDWEAHDHRAETIRNDIRELVGRVEEQISKVNRNEKVKHIQ